MAEIINKNYKPVQEYDITCPKCGCLARYKRYEISTFEDCYDIKCFEVKCPNCHNCISDSIDKLEKFRVKTREEKKEEKLTVGKATYNFINNGGWITMLVLAGFGLLLCIIRAILWFKINGFDWTAFIAYLALFAFCGWALWNGVYKTIKNNPKAFKVKEIHRPSDIFKE